MIKYLIIFSLFFSVTITAFGSELPNYEEPPYVLKANIREWRLKVVDGNIYKRLYDYSARKWVGNWIRA